MLISVALIFFLMLGAVSAEDVGNVSSVESSSYNSDLSSPETDVADNLSAGDTQEPTISEDSVSNQTWGVSESSDFDDVLNEGNASGAVEKEASIEVTSPSTLIKGDYFSLKLSDNKGIALEGKAISISVNGKTFDKTTNANGIVTLKMSLNKNYYTVSYSFDAAGYVPIKAKTDVLVVTKSATTLKGSDYVAYKGFSNPFKVTLTADGIRVANKKIKFKINGKTYYRYTNSNGNAYLYIKLKAGKYAVSYSYAGEKNLKSSSGKAVVTVKKMPTKISRANSLVYYSKISTPFKVKVVDARGNPVSGKVVFKIGKKKYTRNLDSKGIATINLKLSKGNHKIYYTFYKTAKYAKSSASKTLYFKSKKTVNNGFWLFGYNMKKVNLATLAKYGTKHIFLNYAALSLHGKAAVEKFIKNANDKGIRVHIWMQIFYDGKWVSPVTKDGTYKHSFFNSKIKEAKKYASIKGVAGVHMDYLRFPGTAYQYKNGVAAINYFTKKVCDAVHKVNSKLVVSAAVMPEPESMKYYYGQDIPTMTKYLDVIIPMVYKGNYGTGTSWIGSITSAFVKQSKGAQVWTGIQTYKSDSDVTKLSKTSLLKDARSAASGGATGVILFRWGLTNFINFAKL